MACMKDTILLSQRAGTWGLVVSCLVPFVDHSIHIAKDSLVRLGDEEVKCQGKAKFVNTVLAKKKKKGGWG